MKQEQKLQKEIVAWFRSTYTEKRRNLIMLKNELIKPTFNQLNQAKLMGLTPGASDLLCTLNGCMFIELKIESTRHEVDHLKRQYHFLKSQEESGHIARFVFYFHQAVDLISGVNHQAGMTPDDFYEKYLKNAKTQTIKL
jgi:hypothetical protein